MFRRIAWATLLFATACSSSEAPLDCPTGAVFSGGACRVSCQSTRECLASEVCENNACVPLTATDASEPTDATGEDARTRDAATFPDAELPDIGMTECSKHDDCGQPTMGEWGECHPGTNDVCSGDGEKKRPIFEQKCVDNTCTVVQSEEKQPCRLDTEGRECAPDELGDFSECVAQGECAAEGTRSRELTQFRCRGEQCTKQHSAQLEQCPRMTEGDPCGPIEETTYSECLFAEECRGDGERTMTTTLWSCAQNSCTPLSMSSPQTCARTTAPDGEACNGSGNESQCCDGVCIAKDDDANCGVCGLSCGVRDCQTIQRMNGDFDYACACELSAQCTLDYGLRSSCLPTQDVCSCDCPAGPNPCAGQCAVGLCYVTGNHGVCAY